MKTTFKKWTTLVFWIMVFCLLLNTVGRSIPIYFVNPAVSEHFGRVVFITTLITVCFTLFVQLYNKEKNNWIFSGLISILITFFTFIILSFITFFDGFSSFTDVQVLYVKKDDSKIKIIRQYVDSGALGDGHIAVLRKEILSFLKYEETIDTNSINKSEWIKQNP